MLLALLLLACQQGTEQAPVAAAPVATAVTLEAWEAQILGPALEEIRAGVRTTGEQPFGVCEGKRDCDKFLGPTPGLLPEGSFFVRAEVKVPQVGEGWQAVFKAQCTSTDVRGNQNTQDHEKVYDVKYTGKDRTYRLQPLWKIQSPHPGGARSCDFTLTPMRPDGVAGETLTGHYETAAPPETAPTAVKPAPPAARPLPPGAKAGPPAADGRKLPPGDKAKAPAGQR